MDNAAKLLALCLVCDDDLGELNRIPSYLHRPNVLFTRTPASSTLVRHKLESIVRDVVPMRPELCCLCVRCAGLINVADALETELADVRHKICEQYWRTARRRGTAEELPVMCVTPLLPGARQQLQKDMSSRRPSISDDSGDDALHYCNLLSSVEVELTEVKQEISDDDGGPVLATGCEPVDIELDAWNSLGYMDASVSDKQRNSTMRLPPVSQTRGTVHRPPPRRPTGVPPSAAVASHSSKIAAPPTSTAAPSIHSAVQLTRQQILRTLNSHSPAVQQAVADGTLSLELRRQQQLQASSAEATRPDRAVYSTTTAWFYPSQRLRPGHYVYLKTGNSLNGKLVPYEPPRGRPRKHGVKADGPVVRLVPGTPANRALYQPLETALRHLASLSTVTKSRLAAVPARQLVPLVAAAAPPRTAPVPIAPAPVPHSMQPERSSPPRQFGAGGALVRRRRRGRGRGRARGRGLLMGVPLSMAMPVRGGRGRHRAPAGVRSLVPGVRHSRRIRDQRLDESASGGDEDTTDGVPSPKLSEAPAPTPALSAATESGGLPGSDSVSEEMVPEPLGNGQALLPTEVEVKSAAE